MLGNYVLDVGTGTGTIAFYCAACVGDNGRVIGVDISKGMLEQAKRKLTSSTHRNIEFLYADMENLKFPKHAFDKIYCANTFFCTLNPQETLRKWFNLLKPGGALAFHAIPEASFFWVSEARNILRKYGFEYALNTPTGTIEKTSKLLTEAGFKDYDIKIEKNGYYVPLERARKSWITRDEFAPGQYPHPVYSVPEDIYIKCQEEYEKKIEVLATQEGVWNDVTMYYIYAKS
jgi:ubiquinone/menaquinone biosynthesis C-methylase UbiE